VKYVVSADDKLIDGQVERKKQFGKAILKKLLLRIRFDWNFHKRRKRNKQRNNNLFDLSKTKQLLINSLVKK
jgi:hypothetical protein